MYALILSAIVGLAFDTQVAADTADVIELNHYYDEQGNLVFDQLIFWEWWGEESAYHVFAWRFVKSPSQIPRRDWHRGGYVIIWHDSGQLRRVRSPARRETWTQYDPEVYDRRFVPQDQRRGLIGHRKSKDHGPPSNEPPPQH